MSVASGDAVDEDLAKLLQSNVDLREYSKQVAQELKGVEAEAVQDYIREAENITDLHEQIQLCDKVLQQMETLLGGFQSDLGAISSEIQSLQEQSVHMSVKLKNRQAVRGELSQFVDEMIVTDKMINTIVQSPVQETVFLEQIHELMHKIQFCQEQSFKDAKCAMEVSDVLEKLKIQAIAKIREFLLQKIMLFKKPLTNYQVPQNAMLNFRFYNEFLMANERQVAQEIKDEYVDTVNKMFYSYFKAYAGRLSKLQLSDQATRDDTVGAIDEGRSTKRTRATVFTLGERGKVLQALEEDIIVPHMAQQANKKFQLEALFRSLQFCVVENACREYLFLCDFFMVSGQAALDLFQQVLGRSLEVLLKSSTSLIGDSYDSIGLLLCIHVAMRLQALAHKRGVHALDGYWLSILEETLWPRLLRILFVHIDSVRSIDPTPSPTDTRPHYIVRRYAEFAAAIVGLNKSMPDDRVTQAMATLQTEIEAFVHKLSAMLPRKKDQLVFLINNYDMLLGVLSENTTEDSPEATAFRELQSNVTSRYIDEILFPHFGPLIRLVKECEALTEAGQTDMLHKYSDQLPTVGKQFLQNWKKALEAINQEVMLSFTNFKNGTNILQNAFTCVVQHYHGFLKIVAMPQFTKAASKVETINIHHLMVEVKKYKPSF